MSPFFQINLFVLSVLLLSERLLSTLAFPFGNDMKELTTFDKSLYFLSLLEDITVKTLDQKKSIWHILSVFGSLIQFSLIFSNQYNLHWSFTMETSLLEIKCRMRDASLPMASTDQLQDLKRGERQVIYFNIIELRGKFFWKYCMTDTSEYFI